MPSEISTVEIDCPLCGSNDYRRAAEAIDHTYGVPGKFTVVRCVECRHLYINPRPIDACLLACYPNDYAPYVEKASDSEAVVAQGLRSKIDQAHKKSGKGIEAADTEDAVAGRVASETSRDSTHNARSTGIRGWMGGWLRWLWNENATVVPPPPVPGQSKMLELGCAHGGFLATAQADGWLVEGVEPNPVAVAAAREKGLRVTEGFLDNFPGEPATLDWVALWMVLEHVPNPGEVIAQIASLLKPGGVVTLSIPNAATWERLLFRRYWLGYDVPRHLQDFTPDSIRHLLQAHGFRRVQIQHQSNTRYWFGSLACWGQTMFPAAKWPERWMEYFRREPPRSWAWALALPGKVNALLELSGRITVTAQKAP